MILYINKTILLIVHSVCTRSILYNFVRVIRLGLSKEKIQSFCVAICSVISKEKKMKVLVSRYSIFVNFSNLFKKNYVNWIDKC